MKSENNYKTLETYINGPDRSRLTFYVLGNHYELLIHLVNAVLEAQKHNNGESGMEKPLEDASGLFSQMADNLFETCQPNPKKTIKQREEEIEKMVNLLEVSWIYLDYILNFLLLLWYSPILNSVSKFL